MNQLLAIAKNTLLQTVRQPIYGIIVLVTLGGMALAPALTGWTMDDDNKLLRDIGLSTLLIQGLFLACFGAVSVIHGEVEDKTVLTVIAKPVGRPLFILGKYLGVLGALLVAHYLAGVAFYMTLRHGVLQSAAEKPDWTVIILGPGLMVLLAVVATVLNYIYDWRFLPTLIALALPFLTLSTGVLLLINRDWELDPHEVVQPIEKLPPECQDPAVFRGIISFRPSEGQAHLAGHQGELVRSDWKGPISRKEQDYLLGLHDSTYWRKIVNFLVEETRKKQGAEIFKAGVLTAFAVALLGALAVAASARFGPVGTFVICLLILCAGLSADHVLKPMTDPGTADYSRWADVAYRAIPNFQIFWMIDALSEDRVIPMSYLARAAGYAATYILAVLLLAMALFQTREVG